MEVYGQMMGEFGKTKTREEVYETAFSPESIGDWRKSGGDASYIDMIGRIANSRPSKADVDKAARDVAKEERDIAKAKREAEKHVTDLAISKEKLEDIEEKERREAEEPFLKDPTLDPDKFVEIVEARDVDLPEGFVDKLKKGEQKLSPRTDYALKVFLDFAKIDDDEIMEWAKKTLESETGETWNYPKAYRFREEALKPVEWEYGDKKQRMPLNAAQDRVKSLYKRIEALATILTDAGRAKIKELEEEIEVINAAILEAGGYVPKETETPGEGGGVFDPNKVAEDLEVKP